MPTGTVFTSTGTWSGPETKVAATGAPLGFATKATAPKPKPTGLVVVRGGGLVVVR